jgi:hypothetical protein
MLIQAVIRMWNKIKIVFLNIFKFKYLQLSNPNTSFKMRNGWYFVPSRVSIYESWVWGDVYVSTDALSMGIPKYSGVSIHMSGYMMGYDNQLKKQHEHPYDLVEVI